MQSVAQSLTVYFERRMARILLLGIISGFPWVLIGSSLSLWLKEDGLSRTAIGWAGLIFGVYAFNFLWAPLIDRIRVPWLTDRLGHRRAWIVTLQAVILLCLGAWSAVDPTANLASVVAIGLVIAIASATQDITIDALRIEQIGTSEGEAMAAGAATAVVGWWTGYKLGGIVALETATAFENAGVEDYWQSTFLVLGVVVVLCNIGLMFVRESSAAARIAAQARDESLVASRNRAFRRSRPRRRLARRHRDRPVDELLPAQRRRHRRCGARLHLPVQDRRGVPRAHVRHLLQGDRVHQVGHRALLQGTGLDHHGDVHRAGRAVRDTDRAGARDVRVGRRDGRDQSPVRRARLDREVGAPVRRGGGHGRPHERVRDRHLRRLHLHAGGPDLYRHPVRAARLDRHRREDPVRGVVRRPGRLAGRRLGDVLRDHDADGGPLARVPVGHSEEARCHAPRRQGAPVRERRWRARRRELGVRLPARPPTA